MKKIENLFIVLAISISLALLSIAYLVAGYESAINWQSVSGIALGIYLYMAYLLLGIVSGKPKKQTHYLPGRILAGEKQEVLANKA